MEKLKAIVNNEKVGNTFFNLFDRWLDESAYEDINEYGKVIANVIKNEFPQYGIELKKSTKKPFGVVISIDGASYHIYAKFSGKYVSLCAKNA